MSRFGISPYVAGGHTTYVGRGGSYLRTTPGGGAVYGSPYGAAIQPGRVDQFNGSGYGGYMPAPSTTPLNDQISQSRGMIPRPPTVAAAPRITPARMSIPIPPGYGQTPPPPADGGTHSQNFLDSVARNNGMAQASANTFAGLKAQGMDDATARRQAYVATHPGMMPAPPAQPAAQAAAAPAAPSYSKEQLAAQGKYYAAQVAQAKAALGRDPEYASPEAQAAYKKAQDDYGGFLRRQGGLDPTTPAGPPAPATQPAATPPPAMIPPRPQQMEAGTKADIPLTAEIINAMHNANGGDASRTVQTLTGYGYDANQATDVLGGMNDKGQLIPPPPQQTYTPGIRMPLSMLGPSNGLDPSQNYGFARQATAGPTIQTPGTVTTSPGYFAGATAVKPPPRPEAPGINGAGRRAMSPELADAMNAAGPQRPGEPQQQLKPIPRDAAMQIFQRAGGDKTRASAMAVQMGFDPTRFAE